MTRPFSSWRRAGALLALLVPAAGACAEPPRIGEEKPHERTPGAVRLATYNIENLFDDRDDPSKSGDAEDIDDTKPEAARKGVADTIRAIDADIIALQEIESFDALIEFREQHLKGLGYDHVISIDVGEGRGIENAVISRFPITQARVWPNMPLGGVHPELWRDKPNMYAGQPLEMRRSPLFVTVQVPGSATPSGQPYDLDLFVVHHKSSKGNEYWREAEAKGVLKLIGTILKDNPKANIAVLGDFNAEPTDKSVGFYMENGMTDLHADRPSDSRGLTHAAERTIDFILVNDNLKSEIVPGTTFVLGTPQLPTDADWRTAPKPEGYASDHCPVVVDLTPVEK